MNLKHAHSNKLPRLFRFENSVVNATFYILNIENDLILKIGTEP